MRQVLVAECGGKSSHTTTEIYVFAPSSDMKIIRME